MVNVFVVKLFNINKRIVNIDCFIKKYWVRLGDYNTWFNQSIREQSFYNRAKVEIQK